MRLFISAIFLMTLTACSPEAAQAIQAMNAQYQYNQAMQAQAFSNMPVAAAAPTPTTTRCYQIGNGVTCREF